ncbi:sodium-dependent organic anion transporter-like [Centruroides vittatus]|uniref:sodium-dependent organic anion transporter-like n=1 Tax=Centruroides vittatus TaxID=120091 RepID=UPI00350F1310
MMPFFGYIYNLIFMFETRMAAGLLIISCCPGGAISNAFAYYLDGNVSLSVTMTTISTIMALGMMPLNVWIYSVKSESDKLHIPYEKMALSLVMITSPVLIGMAIRWKAPKQSVYVTKWGSAIGCIILVAVLIIEFISFRESLHHVSWKLILTSISMPMTGMIMGYLIALICRRPSDVRKTIAIESGIQNAAVAFSIIMLSFDIRKNITILLIPWFYGTAQFVICSLLCLIYYIYIKYLKKQKSLEQENIFDMEDKGNLLCYNQRIV